MLRNIARVSPTLSLVRPLSSSNLLRAIPKKHKLPPRPLWLIKEDEIKEVFIKGGSGAGGQKINKTNSKVQLTHLPTGLVITCQYSRSQEQNRKRARELLALKLEELENPEGCRTAVLNERAQKVKDSKKKKTKRKYKLLDEQKKLEREQEQEQIQEVDIEDQFEQFLSTTKVDLPVGLTVDDYLKKKK
ncbi:putative peptide chain release factor-like protein [Spathaspora sp. JA1]|nr:putative peptide chain release factor-like protein [Spathaspora sp. JA1]